MRGSVGHIFLSENVLLKIYLKSENIVGNGDLFFGNRPPEDLISKVYVSSFGNQPQKGELKERLG